MNDFLGETTKAPQVVILSKDPIYSVLLEMTIREFGFTPKLTALLDRVEQLSMTSPTLAWFIDLDGAFGTVEEITARARSRAPDAKVVFLGGNFTRELAQSCLQQNALALLVKPLIISKLIETLGLLRQEMELLEKDGVIPITEQQAIVKETVKAPVKAEEHPYLRKLGLVCPICKKQFEGLAFKLWTVPTSETDTDFCPICPNTVHPEMYTVMVCPFCLFAHYVGKFSETKVSENKRVVFLALNQSDERKKLSFNLEFRGERTLLHGIKSFELAADSVLELNIRNSEKLAGEFYLKCSWLCRRMGHSISERTAQEKALEIFKKIFKPYLSVNGKFPETRSIQAKLGAGMDVLPPRAILVTGFLAGELSRRLGMIQDAKFYFDEVTHLPFFHQYHSLLTHVNHVIRVMKEETRAASAKA